MQTRILFALLLALASACGWGGGTPSNADPIRKSVDDYVRALTLGDADAVSALVSDDIVWIEPDAPARVGRDAVRKTHQDLFDRFDCKMSARITGVTVIGDIAVAGGTWAETLTPKAGGGTAKAAGGNWAVTCLRQSDGSWKWDGAISGRMQAPERAGDGAAEEAALIQLEQQRGQAIVKPDIAALESSISEEWTCVCDGVILSRPEAVAAVKSANLKPESLQLDGVRPHVFGCVAVVTMGASVMDAYKGSDRAAHLRVTDFLAKRDDGWKSVGTRSVADR